MARLAFLIPDLRGGGAERVAVNLIRHLVGRGHEVDLVVMARSGELLDLVPPEVRVFDLEAGRVRNAIWPLVAYLRERRPAGLQVSMWPITVVAIVAAKVARVVTRVVVSDHSNLSRQYGGSRTAMAALRASIRLFYPRATARVAVSSGCADDLARLSRIARAQFEVIHNPVDAPPAGADASSVAQAWPGPGARILAVGNLMQVKNHALLIRAFAELVKTHPAALMILGEGERRESLEKLTGDLVVAEHVAMPGFVTDPAPYYAAADLFVLSSDYEGFGNVIVEALHAGLPVVSTDCPSGPAEILEPGKHGTLVPCGDPERLAAAMAEALDGVTDCEAQKKRARDFSMEVAADRYLALLLGTPASVPA
ncbi:MAG: glycosyltransferase [Pseudomonadota bacterium]|nr:glycosyltransferase [Pseudomonadota bacterium]